MSKRIRVLGALGAALFIAGGVGFAGAAYAAPRTFVSTAGNDANACGATTPCRGFAKAITVTDVGGEVVVLESGGYGPVTITQSVAINASPGVHAAITSTLDGITINAPGANVGLSGLVIVGSGAGVNKGINIQAAHSVVIDRCRVTGFATGISAAVPAGTVAPGPTISVTQSFVGFNAANGIEISGTSGTNSVGGLVINSQLMRNGGTAIVAGDLARVTVSNSAINNNTNAAQSTATANASRLYVAASAIENVSVSAIRAGPAGTGNAQVTLCDDSINFTNNSTGTVFLRDPDASCSPTTCRIFSCGNIVFGFNAANLENPGGVVEAIGAAGGPVSK
jgi:hypothetical protein